MVQTVGNAVVVAIFGILVSHLVKSITSLIVTLLGKDVSVGIVSKVVVVPAIISSCISPLVKGSLVRVLLYVGKGSSGNESVQLVVFISRCLWQWVRSGRRCSSRINFGFFNGGYHCTYVAIKQFKGVAKYIASC